MGKLPDLIPELEKWSNLNDLLFNTPFEASVKLDGKSVGIDMEGKVWLNDGIIDEECTITQDNVRMVFDGLRLSNSDKLVLCAELINNQHYDYKSYPKFNVTGAIIKTQDAKSLAEKFKQQGFTCQEIKGHVRLTMNHKLMNLMESCKIPVWVYLEWYENLYTLIRKNYKTARCVRQQTNRLM